jgi:hypothetical protein
MQPGMEQVDFGPEFRCVRIFALVGIMLRDVDGEIVVTGMPQLRRKIDRDYTDRLARIEVDLRECRVVQAYGHHRAPGQ